MPLTIFSNEPKPLPTTDYPSNSSQNTHSNSTTKSKLSSLFPSFSSIFPTSFSIKPSTPPSVAAKVSSQTTPLTTPAQKNTPIVPARPVPATPSESQRIISGQLKIIEQAVKDGDADKVQETADVLHCMIWDLDPEKQPLSTAEFTADIKKIRDLVANNKKNPDITSPLYFAAYTIIVYSTLPTKRETYDLSAGAGQITADLYDYYEKKELTIDENVKFNAQLIWGLDYFRSSHFQPSLWSKKGQWTEQSERIFNQTMQSYRDSNSINCLSASLIIHYITTHILTSQQVDSNITSAFEEVILEKALKPTIQKNLGSLAVLKLILAYSQTNDEDKKLHIIHCIKNIRDILSDNPLSQKAQEISNNFISFIEQ